MAAEDDFMAFLADVQTAEQHAVAEEGGKEPGSGEKRPREEQETEVGTEAEAASLPAVKKAKVVAARAKPQVIQAAPQPPEEPPAQEALAYGAMAGGRGGAASASSHLAQPAFSGNAYHGGPPHHAQQYHGAQPYQKGGRGDYDTVMAASGGMGGHGGMGGGGPGGDQAHKKPKKFVRVGAGETWVDPTLNEWPENDFRLFCGDLGNEVSDEVLANAFRKYTSFAKAKVIRNKESGKSKGYGFVSFLDPFDGLKAYREMNMKYVGSRPIKLRKSDWKERSLNEVKKKDKQKTKFLKSLGIS